MPRIRGTSRLTARMPAAKVRIADILGGRFEEVSVGPVRYFRLPSGKSVAAVRVMGVVVDAYVSDDMGHVRLVIEDGTGSISVRAWDQDVELLMDPTSGMPYSRGTVLDVIGRVREWRAEKYLVPQLVVKVENPNWILVRALEILRERLRAAAASSERVEIPERKVDVKKVVLELLRRRGPLREEQITSEFPNPSVDAVLRALDELLEEGLIYLDEQGRYVAV